MLSRSAATSRSRDLAAATRDDDVVAERAMQDVGHRVGVGDHRDRPRPAPRAFSSSHGFARSASVDRRASPGRRSVRPRESCRAARGFWGCVGAYRFRQLASSPGSSRNGSSVTESSSGDEVQRLASLGGVRVVDHRQQRSRRTARSRRCRIADRRRPRSPSRRNASTEIRMNVAEAMTAIDSTLRPGR